MRFAGSEPVTNYLKSSVNMGGVAQAGAKHRSAIRNAATALEGQVGASGVNAAGQVEAASIIADAGVAQAQAAGNASIMQGIGGIASSAIGAFGGGGLPAVGTQARADADMKTLSNFTQADMNNLWKGSFGG